MEGKSGRAPQKIWLLKQHPLPHSSADMSNDPSWGMNLRFGSSWHCIGINNQTSRFPSEVSIRPIAPDAWSKVGWVESHRKIRLQDPWMRSCLETGSVLISSSEDVVILIQRCCPHSRDWCPYKEAMWKCKGRGSHCRGSHGRGEKTVWRQRQTLETCSYQRKDAKDG